jgi:hypothetical protein
LCATQDTNIGAPLVLGGVRCHLFIAPGCVVTFPVGSPPKVLVTSLRLVDFGEQDGDELAL